MVLEVFPICLYRERELCAKHDNLELIYLKLYEACLHCMALLCM